MTTYVYIYSKHSSHNTSEKYNLKKLIKKEILFAFAFKMKFIYNRI